MFLTGKDYIVHVFFVSVPSSDTGLAQNVFLACNAPLGAIIVFTLCLQDNLFLQQPLSRSVLN